MEDRSHAGPRNGTRNFCPHPFVGNSIGWPLLRKVVSLCSQEKKTKLVWWTVKPSFSQKAKNLVREKKKHAC